MMPQMTNRFPDAPSGPRLIGVGALRPAVCIGVALPFPASLVDRRGYPRWCHVCDQESAWDQVGENQPRGLAGPRLVPNSSRTKEFGTIIEAARRAGQIFRRLVSV